MNDRHDFCPLDTRVVSTLASMTWLCCAISFKSKLSIIHLPTYLSINYLYVSIIHLLSYLCLSFIYHLSLLSIYHLSVCLSANQGSQPATCPLSSPTWTDAETARLPTLRITLRAGSEGKRQWFSPGDDSATQGTSGDACRHSGHPPGRVLLASCGEKGPGMLLSTLQHTGQPLRKLSCPILLLPRSRDSGVTVPRT